MICEGFYIVTFLLTPNFMVLLFILFWGFFPEWSGEESSYRCGQKTQNSQEEEEERPERASETRLGVRSVLQRHAGRHQGPEPQRHLRRSVQDRGLHVGWAGGGAETGSPITTLYPLSYTLLLPEEVLYSVY